MFFNVKKKLVVIGLLGLMPTKVFGDCFIYENQNSSPFSGQMHSGVAIEKKSLIILNKLYPKLNIIEKMFKGEVLTCTICSEKYIACMQDSPKAN